MSTERLINTDFIDTKNSYNSLNVYKVIVSIATLPIGTRGTSKF